MTSPGQRPTRRLAVLRSLLVLGLLYGFLVAIRLMGAAIKSVGEDTAGDLFSGVENPFAGLSVGVLATVLVQSSSTTTSTIVALVGQTGAGALKLKAAVPMIMGANIGTTITNTLVSIGHVRQGQEFRRAFAAATVHDFFNLLCVGLLLPLELATGGMQHTAEWLTTKFVGGDGAATYNSPIKGAVKAGGKLVESALDAIGLEGLSFSGGMLFVGVALTITCLILITRNMRILISGPLERALNKALGKSGLIGMALGAVLTVAVQSSSITTSLLVPLCAAGVLTLPNAFPIMLGANVGTTVTGLLASTATDNPAGLTIALVHVIFNVTGILIFYPIPAVRHIPIRCAEFLAERAQKNVGYLFAYVLGAFVLLPLLGYLVF